MPMEVACWACGAAARPAEGPYEALLHLCPACGFGFQPARDPAELHELYGSDYFARYTADRAYDDDARARAYEAEVRARLVERRVPRGRLLEIGCASGHFLGACKRRGFDVTGVEVGAEIARAARERFGVEVTVAPVEELELPAANFDVICAWHVVEHVPEPLAIVQRLARALRPGGWLFVEVPNFGGVRSRREGAAWPLLDLPHHVGQFTPSSLGALLERSGFPTVELTSVPWGIYRPWPRRLVTHANQALKSRSWPGGTRPAKHDLLRAAGQTAL